MNNIMLRTLASTIKEAESDFLYDQTNFKNLKTKSNVQRNYLRKSRKMNNEITKFCRNMLSVMKFMSDNKKKLNPFKNFINKERFRLTKIANTLNFQLPEQLKNLADYFIVLYTNK